MRSRRAAFGAVAIGLAVVAFYGGTADAASSAKGGSTDEPRWLGSYTTDDGIELRVTTARVDRSRMAQGVDLPDACFADEVVSVGVSTPRIAQTVFALFRAEPKRTQIEASTTAQSVLNLAAPSDTIPIDVIVVKTPKRASVVEARAVGWRSDAPVNGGYAVLARGRTRGQPNTPRRRAIRVRVLDDDGRVIDRATGAFGRSDTSLIDWDDPACNPGSSTSSSGSGSSSVVIAVPSTQPLPEPTGAPPADEDAARAAITAAFEGAYPAAGDIDAALANVEGGDSPALREARQKASDANPQYVGRTTAVVTEIRFLDDREAAVRFEFRLDGQPFYSPQVGFAVLTADGWKMSRSTYCDQLQTAGQGIKC